jgi:hypothetical protein
VLHDQSKLRLHRDGNAMARVLSIAKAHYLRICNLGLFHTRSAKVDSYAFRPMFSQLLKGKLGVS